MRASLFSSTRRSLLFPKSLGTLCPSRKSHKSTATSITSTPLKPFYVTTPIFYVNAAPHVGHLYSMVLADIIKRWQILQGRAAVLSTGTDEHGMKVQQAAKKANSMPGAFCDRGAEVFQRLAHRANVSYDYFARTSDLRHRDAVQYAWLMLQQAGLIYLSKHEGWYSVSDETFYPQSSVQQAVEPATGRKHTVSVETGKEVEWTSETNYRFRLSEFREPLLEFYKQNPQWILPESRMKFVTTAVEEGLEDLSISRPSSRLTWGIPVPDDSSQTIYVWLDALMNYAVQAGFPWSPDMPTAGGWPADVHVIGKDILRFHCIYWPAFLMALKLPLPTQILTHAHWTIGREKMSKSTGNVVDPFHAIDIYGVDTIRFYLAHDGGLNDDADYSNHRVVQRYKEIAGALGNLASRVTRGKGWSVPYSIQEMVGSGQLVEKPQNKLDALMWVKLEETHRDFTDRFEHQGVPAGLKSIMDLVYTTNKWFQDREPWGMCTPKDSAVPPHPDLAMVIFLAAESLRICGILLQPYIPGKATLLLDMLGVNSDRRHLQHAVLGADDSYGTSKVPLGKGPVGVLFPPLLAED